MRISKDPEVRKSELIEAAEELFRQDGYEQTTVSDIVRKVGVAQGTFYYYFESKDDIMDAVISHYIDNFQAAIAVLVADQSIDISEKIEIMANTTLNIHKFDLKLAEFLHAEKNFATHQKYMVKSFETLVPLVTGILEQGIRSGLFNVRYPRESVEMMFYSLSYIEETLWACDEDASLRKVAAAEDILTRVLGLKPGQIRLDPGSSKVLKPYVHVENKEVC